MNCMQFNETDQQVKLEFKDVSYFSSGEGGNVSAAIAEHNSATDAHSDIRLLIQGLSERLSALADSDDTTLDQLSEIVAYIKSNRDLISAITTNKVSVSDIVDNLTTNVANKPLSAAQGVALKALIDAITVPTALSDLTDDATHRVVTDEEKAVWNAKSNFTGSYNDLTDKPTIPGAYTLPVASATQLGGVQPVAKTDAMTQSVGVDASGALWTPPGSGGGSGSFFGEYTVAEDVSEYRIFMDVEKYKRLLIFVLQKTNYVPLKVGFVIDGLAGVTLSEGGTSQKTYFMFDVIRASPGALYNGGLYSVYGNSRRSNNPNASTLLWADIQYVAGIANSITVSAAVSDAVISAGSTIVVSATS